MFQQGRSTLQMHVEAEKESDPDPHHICNASVNDKHVIHRLHEPVVSWCGGGIPCNDVPFDPV